MPVISRFFGIIIYMHWKEHSPPHFHAKYQDQEITMDIKTGKINGAISKKALQLINEWRKKHIRELLKDWQLASNRKSLNNIQPLE
jgi:hypothetical protein